VGSRPKTGGQSGRPRCGLVSLHPYLAQEVGRERLALQPYKFAATGIRLDGSELIEAIDLLKQFVDVQELHEKDRERLVANLATAS
jgi:hypothetical protein